MGMYTTSDGKIPCFLNLITRMSTFMLRQMYPSEKGQ